MLSPGHECMCWALAEGLTTYRLDRLGLRWRASCKLPRLRTVVLCCIICCTVCVVITSGVLLLVLIWEDNPLYSVLLPGANNKIDLLGQRPGSTIRFMGQGGGAVKLCEIWRNSRETLAKLRETFGETWRNFARNLAKHPRNFRETVETAKGSSPWEGVTVLIQPGIKIRDKTSLL